MTTSDAFFLKCKYIMEHVKLFEMLNADIGTIICNNDQEKYSIAVAITKSWAREDASVLEKELLERYIIHFADYLHSEIAETYSARKYDLDRSEYCVWFDRRKKAYEYQYHDFPAALTAAGRLRNTYAH